MFYRQEPEEFLMDLTYLFGDTEELLRKRFFENQQCKLCGKESNTKVLLRINYFRAEPFCSEECINIYVFQNL